MARTGMLLGLGAFGAFLLLRRARASAPAFPPPIPAPTVSPFGTVPHVVSPTIPTSPSILAPAHPFFGAPAPVAPTVTPAKPRPPAPAPAGMAVSVPLPLGWRRLDPSEITAALVDTRDQVLAAGFPAGTFAPFNLEGRSYAVLVERDATGLVNVAIAVEDAPSW